MSKIEKFEDIKAWQKARELVKESYRVSGVKEFKNDYSLIDQTRRAAISIMANIAEGFARRTSKEFINFLGIAHASTAELQSHLYVALDQNYINENKFNELYNKADEVSKMTQGLVAYLES
jgi:four helix bundle protein